MLIAEVVKQIYRNPDNFYTVATFETEEKIPDVAVKGVRGNSSLFTAVGTALPTSGKTVCRLEGRWEQTRYGTQYKVKNFSEVLPVDEKGIKAYLSSGVICGIGPALADRIVKKYGTETFDILDRNPEKLLAVRGISKKKLERIRETYENQKKDRELLSFLLPYGITQSKIRKIKESFGEGALEVIRSSPFHLCQIKGFGFLTVDMIARKMLCFNPFDKVRIEAAVSYTLMTAEQKGHLFLPAQEVVDTSYLLLNKDFETEIISRQEIKEIGNEMTMCSGELVYTTLSSKGTYAIYTKKNYEYEAAAAKELMRIVQGNCPVQEIGKELKQFQRKDGITLADKQKLAVRQAFQNAVTVITGGPGRGKTTVLKLILQIAEKMEPGRASILLAPTGKAARRMSEATEREAVTIHRGLKIPEEDGKKDTGAMLDAGLVIVDEFSMVDMRLACILFSRIRTGTRLILVGDKDQLPSVGAGNVFREIIESEVLPVTVLDVFYRQSNGSRIIHNADMINCNGSMLLFGEDFSFVPADTAESAAESILHIYKKETMQGGRNIQDIAVLSPFRKNTAAGTKELNQRIQQIFHPYSSHEKYVQIGDERFFSGDIVMQLKNVNGVSNGDTGIVTYIDAEKKRVTVGFQNGQTAVYEPEDAGMIALSYAMTIHKSQGSEYPVVIIPMVSAFSIMLKRNLLYTAVTRAKEKVIIVGQKKALYQAIHTNDVEKRNTLLARRLKMEQDRQKVA